MGVDNNCVDESKIHDEFSPHKTKLNFEEIQSKSNKFHDEFDNLLPEGRSSLPTQLSSIPINKDRGRGFSRNSNHSLLFSSNRNVVNDDKFSDTHIKDRAEDSYRNSRFGKWLNEKNNVSHVNNENNVCNKSNVSKDGSRFSSLESAYFRDGCGNTNLCDSGRGSKLIWQSTQTENGVYACAVDNYKNKNIGELAFDKNE